MWQIIVGLGVLGSFYIAWRERKEAQAEREAKQRVMKDAAKLYNEQKQHIEEARVQAAVLMGVAKDALRDGLGENKP